MLAQLAPIKYLCCHFTLTITLVFNFMLVLPDCEKESGSETKIRKQKKSLTNLFNR